MKYIAAAALHQKALNILSVIEDAEERIAGRVKELDKLVLVSRNWREELTIFPYGKPSAAQQEKDLRNLEITRAAHRRLCAYYSKILSRLIDLQ